MTVNVAVIGDHVAEIDADAKPQAALFGQIEQAASADFSYGFLIGSGRAGSARNGGERASVQPGQVMADAMRARGPG